MSTLLTRVVAIAGAGFLLGVGHSWMRVAWMGRPGIVLSRAELTPTGGAPLVPPTKPGTGDPSDTESSQEVSPLDAPVKAGSLTLREASDLHEQGAYFLDARHEEDFVAGRIAGAILMPASRAETREGQADLDTIPPGSVVVIYCTGGDCDASENTAIRLTQLQYEFDVRILGKGYSDWQEAGLAVESGEVAP